MDETVRSVSILTWFCLDESLSQPYYNDVKNNTHTLEKGPVYFQVPDTGTLVLDNILDRFLHFSILVSG